MHPHGSWLRVVGYDETVASLNESGCTKPTGALGTPAGPMLPIPMLILMLMLN